MILKETLRKVVISQRAGIESADYGTPRNRLGDVDLRLPYALIITGIRRCGKSTMLRQLSSKIQKFYYLNFDDTRLTGFEVSDFEKLDEIFTEEHGECNFYLFDEIQNVAGWELFVRSRLNNKKRFVITGSNASLLSKELGTHLTGRHIDIELFPFSFSEMLSFKGKKPSLESFDEYFANGGFPEYLKYGKSEILRELFQDIIQRDIVVRHGIRDVKSLKEMALYLLTNSGKEFSFNGLKKSFDLGSTNTAISFVSFFEDSYLIFTIPKFDYSPKKRLVGQKKAYSIDNGLSAVNSVSFSSDKGRLLENLVFLALRRARKEIFYFKEIHECDFVVKGKKGVELALQVTYELSNDNKTREIDGLAEAMEKLRLNSGLILTHNQEDRFALGDKSIKVMPVWKWMIENE